MYCSAFKDPRLADCQLLAAVDPHPPGVDILAYLVQRNVPIVSSIDALDGRPAADLAIIASPAQFHAEHTAELLDPSEA